MKLAQKTVSTSSLNQSSSEESRVETFETLTTKHEAILKEIQQTEDDLKAAHDALVSAKSLNKEVKIVFQFYRKWNLNFPFCYLETC